MDSEKTINAFLGNKVNLSDASAIKILTNSRLSPTLCVGERNEQKR